MEKAELKIDYTVYRESYPEGYEDLCRAALEVTKNAYCVYSGFAVGAAVLMNNGGRVRYESGKCCLSFWFVCRADCFILCLFRLPGDGNQSDRHCSPGSWCGSGG